MAIGGLRGITEKVTWLIKVDAKGVSQAFSKIENESAKAVAASETRFQKMSGTFTKVGASMVATGGLIAGGLYRAALAAGDFDEAVNRIEVVFGEAKGTILEFSEAALDAFGVTKMQAVEAAGSFGVFGKSAGLAGDDLSKFALDLVGLAGDMASFNNVSQERAVGAIGAALRGETEAIRALGVVFDAETLKIRAINEGLIEQGDKLDSQTRIIAAYKEIMAQTVDQQGDWARTSESLANQQKLLKARMQELRLEIGQAAIPVVQDLTQKLNDLFDVYDELPPVIRENTGEILKNAAVFGVLAGGTLIATGKIMKMAGSWKELGRMGKVGVAGLAGGALMAMHLGQSMSTAASDADKVAVALQSTTDETDALEMALGGLIDHDDWWSGKLGEASAEQLAALAAKAAEGGFEFANLRDDLMDLGLSFQDATMVQMELRQAWENGTEAHKAHEEAVQSQADKYAHVLQPALVNAARAQFEQASAVRETTKEFPAAEAVTITYGSALGGVVRNADEVARAISEVTSALGGYFEATTTTLDAKVSFHKALDQLITDTEDVAFAIDGASENSWVWIEATQGVRDAVHEAMQAVLDQGGSLEDAQAAGEDYVAMLRDQQTELGLTDLQMQGLIATIGLQPDEAVTKVRIDTTDAEFGAGVAELMGTMGFHYDHTTGRWTQVADIVTQVRPGPGADSPNSPAVAAAPPAQQWFVPRASGGKVRRGATHLVGERGPELFVSGNDGHIVPNGQLGGGGTIIVELSGRTLFKAMIDENAAAGDVLRLRTNRT